MRTMAPASAGAIVASGNPLSAIRQCRLPVAVPSLVPPGAVTGISDYERGRERPGAGSAGSYPVSPPQCPDPSRLPLRAAFGRP